MWHGIITHAAYCMLHAAHTVPDALMPHVPQVRIVREKTTGKVMAMKKLKKAEMLRRGQVSGVEAG